MRDARTGALGFMAEEHEHAACVETWWTRAGSDRSAAASLRVFERAFGAIWTRARFTLGDVTLMAIADRVLHDAAEHHPWLAALQLEPTGISCEDLARDADSLDPDEVDTAVRLVLVQLLVVLGRLTGDVLTPVLHAELCADSDRDQESAS